MYRFFLKNNVYSTDSIVKVKRFDAFLMVQLQSIKAQFEVHISFCDWSVFYSSDITSKVLKYLWINDILWISKKSNLVVINFEKWYGPDLIFESSGLNSDHSCQVYLDNSQAKCFNWMPLKIVKHRLKRAFRSTSTCIDA